MEKKKIVIGVSLVPSRNSAPMAENGNVFAPDWWATLHSLSNWLVPV